MARLLDDRYRVRCCMANALYGDILLCDDTHVPLDHRDRLVVLKHVALDRAMHAVQTLHVVDDPRNERRIAAYLRTKDSHRHVLQYQREFAHERSLYFVMEYAQDGDLHRYLESTPSKRFDEMTALQVLFQVASGLEYLHLNGVAHRDLSLENVFVRDGLCKIGDFGLSTSATHLCTDRVGKAYYMAPEVVRGGEPYDPMAADVWSLGIVFFVLLTGSPLTPLASATEKAFNVFQSVGIDGVLSAWGMADTLSPASTALLQGMLAVDAKERWHIDDVVHVLKASGCRS